MLGRDHDRGHKRVAAIEAAGGTGVFAACDATDKASLKAAHEAVVAALGPVNVLLNAAGGNQPQVTLNDDLDFAAIAIDDWQRCFDLNLGAGALLPCQEFGSAMAARGPGQHHQHRLDRRPPAGFAGGGVLRGQSGRIEPNPVSRAGVGRQRRAGQLHHPGLLPRRAKPPLAL